MQLHSRIALTSVLLAFAMAIPASAQHARERGRGHGPSAGGVVRAVPRSAPAVGLTWVARPRVVRPYAFRPPVYRSYGYRPYRLSSVRAAILPPVLLARITRSDRT